LHERDIDGDNAHNVTPKRPVLALEASNGCPFDKHHSSKNDKKTGKNANAWPNALGGALDTSLTQDIAGGAKSTEGAVWVGTRGTGGIGAVLFDGAAVKR